MRQNFLDIDLLRNKLTDTHFAERDRMGRSLTFLARIVQDGWSKHPREIAVDGQSAVLVDGGGRSRIIGLGKGAYFLSTHDRPQTCRKHVPLTFRNITVYHAPADAEFDLKHWSGKGGIAYSLTDTEGHIQSTQPGGGIY